MITIRNVLLNMHTLMTGANLWLIAISCTYLNGCSAQAQTWCSSVFDAGPGTLPQQQGWVLYDEGVTGPSPAIVTGSLHQSTNVPGYQSWSRSDVDVSFDTSTIVVEFGIEVVYSSQGGSGRTGWSVYVSDADGRVYCVGIASNKVAIIANENPAQIFEAPFRAAGGYHVFTFAAGAGGASLFADGNQLIALPPATAVGAYEPGIIRFGDGTNTAASETRLRYCRALTEAFISQPLSVTTCLAGTPRLSVVTAGVAPFAYQWQWRIQAGAAWADVKDGTNLDPGGRPIHFVAQDAQSASVTISAFRGSGTGPSHLYFRCVATNACGSVISDSATLTILASCPADTNCDSSVNVQDLFAVITAWGPCANPNNCPSDIAPAGGDDLVNVADLLAVITAWGACQ